MKPGDFWVVQHYSHTAIAKLVRQKYAGRRPPDEAPWHVRNWTAAKGFTNGIVGPQAFIRPATPDEIETFKREERRG